MWAVLWWNVLEVVMSRFLNDPFHKCSEPTLHCKHWALLFQTDSENQHMAPSGFGFPTQSHIWFLSMLTNEQKSFGDPLSEPRVLMLGFYVFALFWELIVLYLILQCMLLCKWIFTGKRQKNKHSWICQCVVEFDIVEQVVDPKLFSQNKLLSLRLDRPEARNTGDVLILFTQGQHGDIWSLIFLEFHRNPVLLSHIIPLKLNQFKRVGTVRFGP